MRFRFLSIRTSLREKSPAKAGQSVKLRALLEGPFLIRINEDAFAYHYPSLLNAFLILERENKH